MQLAFTLVDVLLTTPWKEKYVAYCELLAFSHTCTVNHTSPHTSRLVTSITAARAASTRRPRGFKWNYGGAYSHSTAIRPRYDHSTTYVTTCVWAAALRPIYIINRSARLRPVMCYVTLTLMIFDKQSNGRRIEVES